MAETEEGWLVGLELYYEELENDPSAHVPYYFTSLPSSEELVDLQNTFFERTTSSTAVEYKGDAFTQAVVVQRSENEFQQTTAAKWQSVVDLIYTQDTSTLPEFKIEMEATPIYRRLEKPTVFVDDTKNGIENVQYVWSTFDATDTNTSLDYKWSQTIDSWTNMSPTLSFESTFNQFIPSEQRHLHSIIYTFRVTIPIMDGETTGSMTFFEATKTVTYSPNLNMPVLSAYGPMFSFAAINNISLETQNFTPIQGITNAFIYARDSTIWPYRNFLWTLQHRRLLTPLNTYVLVMKMYFRKINVGAGPIVTQQFLEDSSSSSSLEFEQSYLHGVDIGLMTQTEFVGSNKIIFRPESTGMTFTFCSIPTTTELGSWLSSRVSPLNAIENRYDLSYHSPTTESRLQLEMKLPVFTTSDLQNLFGVTDILRICPYSFETSQVAYFRKTIIDRVDIDDENNTDGKVFLRPDPSTSDIPVVLQDTNYPLLYNGDMYLISSGLHVSLIVEQLEIQVDSGNIAIAPNSLTMTTGTFSLLQAFQTFTNMTCSWNSLKQSQAVLEAGGPFIHVFPRPATNQHVNIEFTNADQWIPLNETDIFLALRASYSDLSTIEQQQIVYINSFDAQTKIAQHQIPLSLENGKTLCLIEVALLDNNSNGTFTIQTTNTQIPYVQNFYFASLPTVEQFTALAQAQSWPVDIVPFQYARHSTEINETTTTSITAPVLNSNLVFTSLIYPSLYGSILAEDASVNLSVEQALYGSIEPSTLNLEEGKIEYKYVENSVLTEQNASNGMLYYIRSGSSWLVGTKHTVAFTLTIADGTIEMITNTISKIHGHISRSVQDALITNPDITLSCSTLPYLKTLHENDKEMFYIRDSTTIHTVALHAKDWIDVVPPSTEIYSVKFLITYCANSLDPFIVESRSFSRELLVEQNASDLENTFPLFVEKNGKTYWFVRLELAFVENAPDNFAPIFANNQSFLSQWASIASILDTTTALNNSAILSTNIEYQFDVVSTINRPIAPTFDATILFLSDSEQTLPTWNVTSRLRPNYCILQPVSLSQNESKTNTFVWMERKNGEAVELLDLDSSTWSTSNGSGKWLVGANIQMTLEVFHDLGSHQVISTKTDTSPISLHVSRSLSLVSNTTFSSSPSVSIDLLKSAEEQIFSAYKRNDSSATITLLPNAKDVVVSDIETHTGLKCLVTYRNGTRTEQKTYDAALVSGSVEFGVSILSTEDSNIRLWCEDIYFGYRTIDNNEWYGEFWNRTLHSLPAVIEVETAIANNLQLRDTLVVFMESTNTISLIPSLTYQTQLLDLLCWSSLSKAAVKPFTLSFIACYAPISPSSIQQYQENWYIRYDEDVTNQVVLVESDTIFVPRHPISQDRWFTSPKAQLTMSWTKEDNTTLSISTSQAIRIRTEIQLLDSIRFDQRSALNFGATPLYKSVQTTTDIVHDQWMYMREPAFQSLFVNLVLSDLSWVPSTISSGQTLAYQCMYKKNKLDVGTPSIIQPIIAVGSIPLSLWQNDKGWLSQVRIGFINSETNEWFTFMDRIYTLLPVATELVSSIEGVLHNLEFNDSSPSSILLSSSLPTQTNLLASIVPLIWSSDSNKVPKFDVNLRVQVGYRSLSLWTVMDVAGVPNLLYKPNTTDSITWSFVEGSRTTNWNVQNSNKHLSDVRIALDLNLEINSSGISETKLIDSVYVNCTTSVNVYKQIGSHLLDALTWTEPITTQSTRTNTNELVSLYTRPDEPSLLSFQLIIENIDQFLPTDLSSAFLAYRATYSKYNGNAAPSTVIVTEKLITANKSIPLQHAGGGCLVGFQIGYISGLVSNFVLTWPTKTNTFWIQEYATGPSDFVFRQWIKPLAIAQTFEYIRNNSSPLTILAPSPEIDTQSSEPNSLFVLPPSKTNQNLMPIVEATQLSARYQNLVPEQILMYSSQPHMEYRVSSSDLTGVIRPMDASETSWNTYDESSKKWLTQTLYDAVLKLYPSTVEILEPIIVFASTESLGSLAIPNILRIYTPLSSLMQNIQWNESEHIQSSQQISFYERGAPVTWSLVVTDLVDMLPRIGHQLVYQTTWCSTSSSTFDSLPIPIASQTSILDSSIMNDGKTYWHARTKIGYISLSNSQFLTSPAPFVYSYTSVANTTELSNKLFSILIAQNQLIYDFSLPSYDVRFQLLSQTAISPFRSLLTSTSSNAALDAFAAIWKISIDVIPVYRTLLLTPKAIETIGENTVLVYDFDSSSPLVNGTKTTLDNILWNQTTSINWMPLFPTISNSQWLSHCNVQCLFQNTELSEMKVMSDIVSFQYFSAKVTSPLTDTLMNETTVVFPLQTYTSSGITYYQRLATSPETAGNITITINNLNQYYPPLESDLRVVIVVKYQISATDSIEAEWIDVENGESATKYVPVFWNNGWCSSIEVGFALINQNVWSEQLKLTKEFVSFGSAVEWNTLVQTHLNSTMFDTSLIYTYPNEEIVEQGNTITLPNLLLDTLPIHSLIWPNDIIPSYSTTSRVQAGYQLLETQTVLERSGNASLRYRRNTTEQSIVWSEQVGTNETLWPLTIDSVHWLTTSRWAIDLIFDFITVSAATFQPLSFSNEQLQIYRPVNTLLEDNVKWILPSHLSIGMNQSTHLQSYSRDSNISPATLQLTNKEQYIVQTADVVFQCIATYRQQNSENNTVVVHSIVDDNQQIPMSLVVDGDNNNNNNNNKWLVKLEIGYMNPLTNTFVWNTYTNTFQVINFACTPSASNLTNWIQAEVVADRLGLTQSLVFQCDEIQTFTQPFEWKTTANFSTAGILYPDGINTTLQMRLVPISERVHYQNIVADTLFQDEEQEIHMSYLPDEKDLSPTQQTQLPGSTWNSAIVATTNENGENLLKWLTQIACLYRLETKNESNQWQSEVITDSYVNAIVSRNSQWTVYHPMSTLIQQEITWQEPVNLIHNHTPTSTPFYQRSSILDIQYCTLSILHPWKVICHNSSSPFVLQVEKVWESVNNTITPLVEIIPISSNTQVTNFDVEMKHSSGRWLSKVKIGYGSINDSTSWQPHTRNWCYVSVPTSLEIQAEMEFQIMTSFEHNRDNLSPQALTFSLKASNTESPLLHLLTGTTTTMTEPEQFANTWTVDIFITPCYQPVETFASSLQISANVPRLVYNFIKEQEQIGNEEYVESINSWSQLQNTNWSPSFVACLSLDQWLHHPLVRCTFQSTDSFSIEIDQIAIDSTPPIVYRMLHSLLDTTTLPSGSYTRTEETKLSSNNNVLVEFQELDKYFPPTQVCQIAILCTYHQNATTTKNVWNYIDSIETSTLTIPLYYNDLIDSNNNGWLTRVEVGFVHPSQKTTFLWTQQVPNKNSTIICFPIATEIQAWIVQNLSPSPLLINIPYETVESSYTDLPVPLHSPLQDLVYGYNNNNVSLSELITEIKIVKEYKEKMYTTSYIALEDLLEYQPRDEDLGSYEEEEENNNNNWIDWQQTNSWKRPTWVSHQNGLRLSGLAISIRFQLQTEVIIMSPLTRVAKTSAKRTVQNLIEKMILTSLEPISNYNQIQCYIRNQIQQFTISLKDTDTFVLPNYKICTIIHSTSSVNSPIIKESIDFAQNSEIILPAQKENNWIVKIEVGIVPTTSPLTFVNNSFIITNSFITLAPVNVLNNWITTGFSVQSPFVYKQTINTQVILPTWQRTSVFEQLCFPNAQQLQNAPFQTSLHFVPTYATLTPGDVMIDSDSSSEQRDETHIWILPEPWEENGSVPLSWPVQQVSTNKWIKSIAVSLSIKYLTTNSIVLSSAFQILPSEPIVYPETLPTKSIWSKTISAAISRIVERNPDGILDWSESSLRALLAPYFVISNIRTIYESTVDFYKTKPTLPFATTTSTKVVNIDNNNNGTIIPYFQSENERWINCILLNVNPIHPTIATDLAFEVRSLIATVPTMTQLQQQIQQPLDFIEAGLLGTITTTDNILFEQRWKISFSEGSNESKWCPLALCSRDSLTQQQQPIFTPVYVGIFSSYFRCNLPIEAVYAIDDQGNTITVTSAKTLAWDPFAFGVLMELYPTAVGWTFEVRGKLYDFVCLPMDGVAEVFGDITPSSVITSLPGITQMDTIQYRLVDQNNLSSIVLDPTTIPFNEALRIEVFAEFNSIPYHILEYYTPSYIQQLLRLQNIQMLPRTNDTGRTISTPTQNNDYNWKIELIYENGPLQANELVTFHLVPFNNNTLLPKGYILWDTILQQPVVYAVVGQTKQWKVQYVLGTGSQSQFVPRLLRNGQTLDTSPVTTPLTIEMESHQLGIHIWTEAYWQSAFFTRGSTSTMRFYLPTSLQHIPIQAFQVTYTYQDVDLTTTETEISTSLLSTQQDVNVQKGSCWLKSASIRIVLEGETFESPIYSLYSYPSPQEIGNFLASAWNVSSMHVNPLVLPRNSQTSKLQMDLLLGDMAPIASILNLCPPGKPSLQYTIVVNYTTGGYPLVVPLTGLRKDPLLPSQTTSLFRLDNLSSLPASLILCVRASSSTDTTLNAILEHSDAKRTMNLFTSFTNSYWMEDLLGISFADWQSIGVTQYNPDFPVDLSLEWDATRVRTSELANSGIVFTTRAFYTSIQQWGIQSETVSQELDVKEGVINIPTVRSNSTTSPLLQLVDLRLVSHSNIISALSTFPSYRLPWMDTVTGACTNIRPSIEQRLVPGNNQVYSLNCSLLLSNVQFESPNIQIARSFKQSSSLYQVTRSVSQTPYQVSLTISELQRVIPFLSNLRVQCFDSTRTRVEEKTLSLGANAALITPWTQNWTVDDSMKYIRPWMREFVIHGTIRRELANVYNVTSEVPLEWSQTFQIEWLWSSISDYQHFLNLTSTFTSTRELVTINTASLPEEMKQFSFLPLNAERQPIVMNPSPVTQTTENGMPCVTIQQFAVRPDFLRMLVTVPVFDVSNGTTTLQTIQRDISIVPPEVIVILNPITSQPIDIKNIKTDPSEPNVTQVEIQILDKTIPPPTTKNEINTNPQLVTLDLPQISYAENEIEATYSNGQILKATAIERVRSDMTKFLTISAPAYILGTSLLASARLDIIRLSPKKNRKTRKVVEEPEYYIPVVPPTPEADTPVAVAKLDYFVLRNGTGIIRLKID